ncbi:F-box DNA helicase 1 isoform X2 [Crotalus tigris]|uniref:F-box DNA helicase 1 isoform X2 n=1 Tax=Crotalus tigris TaxID=88082 RepID=UPI00192F95CB|nr:F-box DNA helicase 1 isoform X2 [Crotalus tigris]
MRSFKQVRLTASDCEALRQSPEGTAALTQPLTKRLGTRGSGRGLCPTPRRKKRSKGHQSTITDYFRSQSRIIKCSDNTAESHPVKAEEALENLALDLASDSDDSCNLLGGDGDTVAAPRKRLRFSQGSSHSCGSAGQEVQEHKPWLGSPPEQSSGGGTVKQEVQDIEVDPLPDAHFGLLGTQSGDDVPQGTLEELPDELLQEIFALVPLVDLLQNLCLVCQHWKRIISDVKFIPWKKLYSQYVKAVDPALLTVRIVLQRYSLTQMHPQCMLGFIRCAAAVRSCHCRDPTAILACLERHSLFPKAQICIAKNLPDLESCKEKAAYVRAVMAAIVLFTGGVCDIQELVGCLQRLTSPMSVMDISEMLYCTATLLYAMRENGVQISNRLHYNVFCCLYHLENSACSALITNPGLPSSERGLSPDLQPTSEQQQILNHALTPGQRVKIVAFAGTGKTSTLIQYARKWSHLHFLYLAFNKTIAKQASQLFPDNVKCKTIHSLAYAEVGKHYRRKLNLGSLTSYLVSFVLSNRQGQSLFIRAKSVVQTLAAFFASADVSIAVDHTPIWCKNNHGEKVLVDQREKQIIVEEAKEIWSKMQTLSPTGEMAHRMTHDGYLKLWQLQKPSLSEYDVILVDEAQDCTPAVMDIVLSQPCGVILVGDPHQQIYTFRGAVNTLSEVPHSRIFYLTQSFRFGSEIAYVGATILDVSKGVQKKTLVGNKQESDVSGVGVEGTVAHLSRTNKTVFEDAVKLTCGDAPAKIHLLGGLKAFGLEKIHDLWKLLHPELRLEIKDPFIKKWAEKGLASIKDYADKAEDKQLEIKIAIVETYRDRIPELVERITRCHVSAPKKADHILGTVHKAKGLEFDTVQVAGDFASIPFTWPYLERMPRSPPAVPEDEWNLLYVAVTRAKEGLILPRFLTDILKVAKEYYVRFELADKVRKTTSLWCSERGCCNAIPADSVLIPKRTKFVYTDGTQTPEGLLCPFCTTRTLGPIAQLTGCPTIVQEAACRPEVMELPPAVRLLLEIL